MSNKWRNGFKVISENRMSAVVTYGQVHYPKDAEARPLENCGPLVCFTDASQAKSFRDALRPRGFVVRCKYIPDSGLAAYTPNHAKPKSLTEMDLGSALASVIKCLD